MRDILSHLVRYRAEGRRTASEPEGLGQLIGYGNPATFKLSASDLQLDSSLSFPLHGLAISLLGGEPGVAQPSLVARPGLRVGLNDHRFAIEVQHENLG